MNHTFAKISLVLGVLGLPATALADIAATHGMVLFGGQTTYASHLPMFHAPHNYQAVFEITIVDPPRGVGAWGEYKELSNANKNALFTLVPEKMDLSAVIAGQKNSFQANIFQGHFEKDGVNLGPVWVNVSKVVYSQNLNSDSTANPDYIVFGSKGEYFAVKKIAGIGSYDSILKVSPPKQFNIGDCPSRLCGIWVPTPFSDDSLPISLEGAVLSLPAVGEVLKNSWGLTKFKTNVEAVIYGSKEDLSH
jgi:hypothetical protein